MENKFKSNYEIPLLEERKQKLEEVRSLKQPIMFRGIGDHEQKYRQIQQ